MKKNTQENLTENRLPEIQIISDKLCPLDDLSPEDRNLPKNGQPIIDLDNPEAGCRSLSKITGSKILFHLSEMQCDNSQKCYKNTLENSFEECPFIKKVNEIRISNSKRPFGKQKLKKDEKKLPSDLCKKTQLAKDCEFALKYKQYERKNPENTDETNPQTQLR